MDEFGFYQEVYPVVLYIGDNPTVVTFHNDTVVEAIVIYNRPETAYPVRLWVEGKGAADGNVTFTYVNYFYELAPPAGSTEGGTHVTLTGSGFATEFTFRSPGGGEDMGSSRVEYSLRMGGAYDRDDDDMVGDDMAKRIGDGYSGGQACAVTEAGGERLRCVTGVANEKVAVNEPNTITSLEARVHHNEKNAHRPSLLSLRFAGPLFLLLLSPPFPKVYWNFEPYYSSAPTRPRATRPSASPARPRRPARAARPGVRAARLRARRDGQLTRRCHFSWADACVKPLLCAPETYFPRHSPRSPLRAKLRHTLSSCSAPTARACPRRARRRRGRGRRAHVRARRDVRGGRGDGRGVVRRLRVVVVHARRQLQLDAWTQRTPPAMAAAAADDGDGRRPRARGRARAARRRRGRDLDRARRRRERLRQLHGRALEPHARRPVGGRAPLHARGGQRAARRGRRRARDRALRGRRSRQDHGQQRARDPAERDGRLRRGARGIGRRRRGGRAPRLDRGRAEAARARARLRRRARADGAHLHVRRRGRRPRDARDERVRGRRGARLGARPRARRSLFLDGGRLFLKPRRLARSLCLARAQVLNSTALTCVTPAVARATHATVNVVVNGALSVCEAANATNATAPPSVGPLARGAGCVFFFGPTPRDTPVVAAGPSPAEGTWDDYCDRDTPYWRHGGSYGRLCRQTITLAGDGFVPGNTTVTIGDAVLNLLAQNATALVCELPRHAAGAYPLAVHVRGKGLAAAGAGVALWFTFGAQVRPTSSPRPRIFSPTLEKTFSPSPLALPVRRSSAPRRGGSVAAARS